MRRARFTIAWWMAATAVLGVNIGLVRAYLLAEGRGEHLDLADHVVLILFPLQFGLWRYLSTQGRRRRFWLGFLASGLAATLALPILLSSPALSGSNGDLNDWYTEFMSELSYFYLPVRVDAFLSHEHWDWFLALIYFLPEFFAACFGGLLAACLFKVDTPRPSPTAQASPA